MRRGLLAFGMIGAALSLAIAPACAQTSQNAEASVTVVTVFSVQRTQNLEFGRLQSNNGPSGAGTLVVGTLTSNTWSVTGGVNQITPAAPRRAEFALTGQAERAYHVNFPAGPVAVPEAGGNPANTLYASAFIARTVSVGTGFGVLSSPAGTDTVYVGGTLTVPAGTNPGTYTLALEITADYD